MVTYEQYLLEFSDKFKFVFEDKDGWWGVLKDEFAMPDGCEVIVAKTRAEFDKIVDTVVKR